ncbi:MAG: hypothetical protein ACYC2R_12675 [Burkholderiales bacterium]
MKAAQKCESPAATGHFGKANQNRRANLTKFKAKVQANRADLHELITGGACSVAVGNRKGEVRVIGTKNDWPLDARWLTAISCTLEETGNFAPIPKSLLREMLEFCADNRVLP